MFRKCFSLNFTWALKGGACAWWLTRVKEETHPEGALKRIVVMVFFPSIVLSIFHREEKNSSEKRRRARDLREQKWSVLVQICFSPVSPTSVGPRANLWVCVCLCFFCVWRRFSQSLLCDSEPLCLRGEKKKVLHTLQTFTTIAATPPTSWSSYRCSVERHRSRLGNYPTEAKVPSGCGWEGKKFHLFLPIN